MVQQVKALSAWQCKPENLSFIYRTHVKVEKENNLRKTDLISTCMLYHIHPPNHPLYTNNK